MPKMSLVDSPLLWSNKATRAPKLASKQSDMAIRNARRGLLLTISLFGVCSAILVMRLSPE